LLRCLARRSEARMHTYMDVRKEQRRRVNPLNAELNPIRYMLVLLGDLMFMGPIRATPCGLFTAIVRHRNKDLRENEFFVCRTTLIKWKLEISLLLTFL
jgi:hypothetical protein